MPLVDPDESAPRAKAPTPSCGFSPLHDHATLAPRPGETRACHGRPATAGSDRPMDSNLGIARSALQGGMNREGKTSFEIAR